MGYLAYHKMILLVYPFLNKSAIQEWYQIITNFRIASVIAADPHPKPSFVPNTTRVQGETPRTKNRLLCAVPLVRLVTNKNDASR